MSDIRESAVGFKTGMAALGLLAAVLGLSTIALLEQSWRLGIGAIGGGLTVLMLLFMFSGVALRRARRIDAAEAAGERVQCQKPIYNGTLSSPVPCADDAGHEGPCTP